MFRPIMLRSVTLACITGALLVCLGVTWYPADTLRAVIAAPSVSRSRVAPHAASPKSLAARIIARPIFDARRRPAVLQASRTSQPAALPRLAGTLITHASKLAIFAGMPRSAVVQEGETFAGMTLENIAAGRITLWARGQRFVLTVTPAAQAGQSAPILQVAERAPEGQHEE
jgi:hypothetical protein